MKKDYKNYSEGKDIFGIITGNLSDSISQCVDFINCEKFGQVKIYDHDIKEEVTRDATSETTIALFVRLWMLLHRQSKSLNIWIGQDSLYDFVVDVVQNNKYGVSYSFSDSDFLLSPDKNKKKKSRNITVLRQRVQNLVSSHGTKVTNDIEWVNNHYVHKSCLSRFEQIYNRALNSVEHIEFYENRGDLERHFVSDYILELKRTLSRVRSILELFYNRRLLPALEHFFSVDLCKLPSGYSVELANEIGIFERNNLQFMSSSKNSSKGSRFPKWSDIESEEYLLSMKSKVREDIKYLASSISSSICLESFDSDVDALVEHVRRYPVKERFKSDESRVKILLFGG